MHSLLPSSSRFLQTQSAPFLTRYFLLQLNIQLLQKEIAEKEPSQGAEEKPEEAESGEKEEPAAGVTYPSRKKM